MKKLLTLATILSLAACGGGSGGNGGPTYRTAVGSEAIASNKAITAMVSEVGIIENGGLVPNLGRAATGSANTGGTIYTSYRLDDVDFKIFGDLESAGLDTMKFTVNNDGKITGIKILDTGNHGDTSDHDDRLYQTYNRSGDENKFNSAGIIDRKLSGDLAFRAYAEELELRYSDFGALKGTLRMYSSDPGSYCYSNECTVDASIPFAGGYDVMKIDKSQMSENMTFHGKAIGQVMLDDKSRALEDNNATLNFNNGSETLSANFDNWYDIEVSKDSSGNKDFAFIGNNKGGDSDFDKLHSNGFSPVENPESFESETLAFDANYYGENGAAQESVALMQYMHTDGDPEGKRMTVQLGFGGVK